MNKKLIILTAAAGLVSFTGAFVFAWLTEPASTSINQSASGGTDQIEPAEKQAEPKPLQPEVSAIALRDAVDDTIEQPSIQSGVTEKQLKNLVYEVMEKKRQYENMLQSLQKRENRIQIAQDTLQKDIENLNKLRTELATMVAHFKEQRDKLLKSRVEITQTEKVNLAKMAATYDKMDSASAGKILTNMCSPSLNTEPVDGQSNMNDAVKILHYMNERTKAKLLAELGASEPKLAAALCKRLKQITETN